MSVNNKPRVLFLSHGGGPMPLLGDSGHKDMVDCLKKIAAAMPKPSAILLISAHWEERQPTITTTAAPELIYDYYGFPEESYTIKYPCQGEPVLAQQIQNVLKNSGFAAELDQQRGLDHGVFVPLKIMYPEADIPCVQLSLVASLNPEEHVNIGKALQGLNYENLLVIGSGFSFHNMNAFFAAETSDSTAKNERFEGWLLDTCGNAALPENEREQRLLDWDKAPGARFCHPREEHLLPLHVCYGLAQAYCSTSYQLRILNKKASMYLW